MITIVVFGFRHLKVNVNVIYRITHTIIYSLAFPRPCPHIRSGLVSSPPFSLMFSSAIISPSMSSPSLFLSLSLSPPLSRSLSPSLSPPLSLCRGAPRAHQEDREGGDSDHGQRQGGGRVQRAGADRGDQAIELERETERERERRRQRERERARERSRWIEGTI